jgi:6-phosphogluconolactonase
MRLFALLVTALVLGACTPAEPTTGEEPTDPAIPSAATDRTLFVGTYTRTEGHVDGQAAGIYVLAADSTTGALTGRDTLTGIVNPSFVHPDPTGRNLYAVSEIAGPDEPTAYLYAYARTPGGELQFLTRQPTSGGAACHVTTDSQRRLAFAANYLGGIAVFPIQDDGALGEAILTTDFPGQGANPARQEASHPHAVFLSPDERFAYVCDLGTDRIWIFAIDYTTPAVTPAEPAFAELAPGAGPRHLAMHPSQPIVYVINELDNTITAFDRNPDTGALTLRRSYPTLPADFTGESATADIHLTPDGRFLYGSNRGHDSLVAFAVQEDGSLQLVGHYPTRGNFPRNFTIDPDGRFLYVANQNSDNVVQYAIDPETGALDFVAEFAVATPVCLRFG